MKDAHIISILESAPLAGLGETDLVIVRAHVAHCAECRRAYHAAQISAQLLKERAAQEVELSPFFQTRVLAALRERQASTETSALRRLWKTTGALVSGMGATVAALAVLTFLAPSLEPTPQQEVASAFNSYSAEEVILARGGMSDEDLSYDQVLTTIYEADEDAER